MNAKLFLVGLLAALPAVAADNAPPAPAARLVEHRKIWDAAPHNAFTDLIRFQDRWYCVFREGDGHASGAGKLRVLRSDDAQKWTSAALIALDGVDLRERLGDIA